MSSEAVDNSVLLHAGKFGLIYFGILALVFIIAVATPHLAKKIDGKHKKKPERVDDKNIYEVKSIYDAQSTENNNDNEDGTNG